MKTTLILNNHYIIYNTPIQSQNNTVTIHLDDQSPTTLPLESRKMILGINLLHPPRIQPHKHKTTNEKKSKMSFPPTAFLLKITFLHFLHLQVLLSVTS